VSWRRVLTVARFDLLALRQSRDFWLPMVIMGTLFFVVVPGSLLLTITRLGDVEAVRQAGHALDLLPFEARSAIRGTTDAGRTSYALAVFLFAPIAIVIPLTIATAVGASTIVGERERGTGEFLAHSPAEVREIYLGKLLASLLPGYATGVVGFGAYAVLVNVVVGPDVGGWFFPTPQWWVLMLWVLPPFLAFTLSLVLRLSARVKSTAAAQQVSGLVGLPLIGIAYAQASGTLFGASASGWYVGAVAWVVALWGLASGMAAMQRTRLLGVADGQEDRSPSPARRRLAGTDRAGGPQPPPPTASQTVSRSPATRAGSGR